MSSERFDILFAGKTLPGADPAEVRRQLKAIFRIGDEAADRLFSGAPVLVKRGADEATAERFRQVFRDAGAMVRVIPADSAQAILEAAAGTDPEPPVASPVRPAPPGPAPRVPDTSHLSLAPQDGAPLEPPSASADLRHIDVSHLSLITGDWTLADCDPPLPPVPLPDISHLALLLPEEYDEIAETATARET